MLLSQESYEIGSETYPEQPNVWLPEHILPGFRAFMNEFYWECHENAKMILRAMAIGIGLSDEDYFLESHTGHHNQLRLLHYPPISAKQLEDKTKTRLDAHTDWGSITMVFQDECGGLQVYFSPPEQSSHERRNDSMQNRSRTHINLENSSMLLL